GLTRIQTDDTGDAAHGHYPCEASRGTNVRRTSAVKTLSERTRASQHRRSTGTASKRSKRNMLLSMRLTKRRFVIWLNPLSSSQNRVAPSDLKSTRQRRGAHSVKSR